MNIKAKNNISAHLWTWKTENTAVHSYVKERQIQLCYFIKSQIARMKIREEKHLNRVQTKVFCCSSKQLLWCTRSQTRNHHIIRTLAIESNCAVWSSSYHTHSAAHDWFKETSIWISWESSMWLIWRSQNFRISLCLIQCWRCWKYALRMANTSLVYFATQSVLIVYLDNITVQSPFPQ